MEASGSEILFWIMIGGVAGTFINILWFHNVYKNSILTAKHEVEEMYRKTLQEIQRKFKIKFENGEWVQQK